MEKQVSEGSLHKWFKGSKSKDGKGGWVNVVTGGTCASDEPGEGTPKCVSSAKRASMTKKERLSAARRKKKADPGQQQKSGAAKPTYVSTDKPKKKKMKESYTRALTPLSEKAQKCWKGYEKKGTKKMFGKTYNNCVKKEEVVYSEAKVDQGKDEKAKMNDRNQRTYGNRRSVKLNFSKNQKYHDTEGRRHNTQMDRGVKMRGKKDKRKTDYAARDLGTPYKTPGRVRREEVEMEAYSANPAQQAAIAIAKKKKKEDDMVAKKMKKEEMELTEIENNPLTKFIVNTALIDAKRRSKNKKDNLPSTREIRFKSDRTTSAGNAGSSTNSGGTSKINEAKDKKGKGSGTKDACYHKVKSRYSVWPSAYASGALVKCRKVGAANWGNSSKKEDFSDWKAEFIWEDGDSSKKIDEGALDRFEPIPGKPGRLRLKQDVKVKPVPLPSPPRESGAVKPVPMPQPNFRRPKPKLSDFVDHYDWRSELGEDWQKTNRQDKTDGMSQKAVNAYKRENPGSKLKTAVTAKPSTLKRGSKKAKRRKSFCSRMKGMKKRLTSAKTARDPDSRINKALRRWNC